MYKATGPAYDQNEDNTTLYSHQQQHPTTMGSRRQSALSKSIRTALFRDPNDFNRTTVGHIRVLFSIFYIELLRYANILFQRLRNNVWQIDENEYLDCFSAADRVKSMGDLGFSGSVCAPLSNLCSCISH